VRIGKLFHLTLLVDDFEGPQQFFSGIFSPLVMMRGYSSHWHRYAAIYVIGETSIEPMHVLPPRAGEAATSWYRYMERHGPRVHNLAFYVDDHRELARRLEEAGVRTTMAGTDSTVFAHPKDTPGMLEFHEPQSLARDPRFSAGWDQFRTSFWPNHALGFERLSHVTIVVHDLDKAGDFYGRVLGAVPLAERHPTLPATESRFWLVGEDTVVELAQPVDEATWAWRELQQVGQGAVAVTFKVADLDRAVAHLRRNEAPIATVDEASVVLDRTRTWGVEYRFTAVGLAGDPRSKSKELP